MAKLPKFSAKEEEEYHFTEKSGQTEQASVKIEQTETETQREKGRKKILNKRGLVLLIIVLIVIAAAYWFFSYKSEMTSSIPVLGHETRLTTAPVKPLHTAIAPTTHTILSSGNTMVSTGTEDLTKQLTETARQNQQQIQQLNARIQQLQDAVVQLNQRLTVVTDTANTLVQLQKKPAVTKIPVKAVKPGVKVVPPLQYSLRALVPNMAWLQVKNGRRVVKLITVKVGSQLTGYGTVTAISPAAGKVSTSSGKVIRYAASDHSQ